MILFPMLELIPELVFDAGLLPEAWPVVLPAAGLALEAKPELVAAPGFVVALGLFEVVPAPEVAPIPDAVLGFVVELGFVPDFWFDAALLCDAAAPAWVLAGVSSIRPHSSELVIGSR